MADIQLGCHLVTAKNLPSILRVYTPLLPTQTNNTVMPQPGDYIVIRRITVPDLFDENVVQWFEHYWVVTAAEFDQKFDFIEGDYGSETFSLITPKS